MHISKCKICGERNISPFADYKCRKCGAVALIEDYKEAYEELKKEYIRSTTDASHGYRTVKEFCDHTSKENIFLRTLNALLFLCLSLMYIIK